MCFITIDNVFKALDISFYNFNKYINAFITYNNLKIKKRQLY